jgi:hypothetical protein
MTKARDIASIPNTLDTTEISYLDGVTSNVQTQIDGKSATSHNHDASYSALGHNHDAAYAALGHNHTGTYEPADATIVKDADIGVTVQAYDANLVTYATNGNTAYGWGNHGVAGYLTGNQTITLSGDATGSGTTAITVTVADDSHNHIIGNVDGLQTALDGKMATGTDKRAQIYYIGRDTNDYIGVETTQINFVLDGNTDARLYNNGDFHADGNVIAYSTSISDERLKENIEVVSDAVNKVKQIRGVTFNYKADGKASAGVIAQEVEKILPQAVSETVLMKVDDGQEYKVVQYDALHAVLIEAVKELTARVEALESK